MNNYFLIGEKIANYLKAHQQPNGTLYDEIDERKTPDSHYAHTFFSLAMMQLYKITNDSSYLQAGIRAVRYYLDLPERKRGHRELNNLALLLTYIRFKKQVNKMPNLLREKMRKYIATMGFDSDLDINMSNNWIAMKSLCEALRYVMLRKQEYLEDAQRLMRDHITKCQLEDGFFYDWPNERSARSWATPLTYHAKICSTLLLYYEYVKDIDILKSAIKGLDVLKQFIADDGEAFYYGRSNNALFAYASGIYAYEKAASFLETLKKRTMGFRFCAVRLLRFIEKWQQADGHMNIVPNDQERVKCGWDEYMHRTVYNAYAAAFLLMLSDLELQREPILSLPSGSFYAKDAGLLRIKEDGVYLSFSIKGQSVSHGTMFSDPRYYGMNLLCLKYRGIDILPPPPLFSKSLTDTLNPMLTGFLPYILVENKVYSPRVYDVANLKKKGPILMILAKGKPTAYEPKYLYELKYRHSMIYSIYKKVLNKREIAYNVKKLPRTTFYRAIVVLPQEPIIFFVDLMNTDLSEKDIRMSLLSGRFKSNRIKVTGNTVTHRGKHVNTIIQSLYPRKPDEIRINPAPTSKGICYAVSSDLTLKPEEDRFCSIYALYLDEHNGQKPAFEVESIDLFRSRVQIMIEKGKFELEVDFIKDL